VASQRASARELGRCSARWLATATAAAPSSIAVSIALPAPCLRRVGQPHAEALVPVPVDDQIAPCIVKILLDEKWLLGDVKVGWEAITEPINGRCVAWAPRMRVEGGVCCNVREALHAIDASHSAF